MEALDLLPINAYFPYSFYEVLGHYQGSSQGVEITG